MPSPVQISCPGLNFLGNRMKSKIGPVGASIGGPTPDRFPDLGKPHDHHRISGPSSVELVSFFHASFGSPDTRSSSFAPSGPSGYGSSGRRRGDHPRRPLRSGAGAAPKGSGTRESRGSRAGGFLGQGGVMLFVISRRILTPLD